MRRELPRGECQIIRYLATPLLSACGIVSYLNILKSCCLYNALHFHMKLCQFPWQHGCGHDGKYGSFNKTEHTHIWVEDKCLSHIACIGICLSWPFTLDLGSRSFKLTWCRSSCPEIYEWKRWTTIDVFSPANVLFDLDLEPRSSNLIYQKSETYDHRDCIKYYSTNSKQAAFKFSQSFEFMTLTLCEDHFHKSFHHENNIVISRASFITVKLMGSEQLSLSARVTGH